MKTMDVIKNINKALFKNKKKIMTNNYKRFFKSLLSSSNQFFVITNGKCLRLYIQGFWKKSIAFN